MIAIIAILAAILFPVFAKAREKARQASCTMNQRQMGQAVLMYTQDFDEGLPPYSDGFGYHGCNGYLGADGTRWADMILPYTKSIQVYDCPSLGKHISKFAGGQWLDIMTYSYGYTTPVTNTGADAVYGVAGRPLTEIQDVAGTVMIADTGGTGDPSGRIGIVSTDTVQSIAVRVDGFRHSGAGALDWTTLGVIACYTDGHSKWTRLAESFPRAWTVTAD